MSETIPLAQLPRRLKELSPDGNAPGYRTLYLKVLDGVIPAEQQNGRWRVADADVPAIAESLGLKIGSAAPSRQMAVLERRDE